MQENLHKLNQFVEGQRRNQGRFMQTIDVNNQQTLRKQHSRGSTGILGHELLKGQGIVNISKGTLAEARNQHYLSDPNLRGKKKSTKQKEAPMEFNEKIAAEALNRVNEDSSRLSGDFYEEYFRLLNSLRKEQKSPKEKGLTKSNHSSAKKTGLKKRTKRSKSKEQLSSHRAESAPLVLKSEQGYFNNTVGTGLSSVLQTETTAKRPKDRL